jgi:lysophospholipase L1-like esterase
MTISLSFVCGVIRTGYSRYVAIGDSQTEGLWDGDDTVGVLGFADRLAVMLDSLYPGLQYANLAIRGKLVADVLREQVPEALAMQPDLITVCAGMNDVIQPGRSFGRALADLDYVYAALAESGATVVTTTFPNVAQFLPLGRLVSGRLARINEAIRTAAGQYGPVQRAVDARLGHVGHRPRTRVDQGAYHVRCCGRRIAQFAWQ